MEHARGLHNQPSGCGPLHPRVSPKTFSLDSSVFYYLGKESCMADNASCLLDLSDPSFPANMSVDYPQPLSLWHISSLLLELLFCVIYMLHRKSCEQALFRAPDPTRPLLQATPGLTWERVGFSGMEGNCSNPPLGWPPRPHKSSQFPSSHRPGQAPCP